VNPWLERLRQAGREDTSASARTPEEDGLIVAVKVWSNVLHAEIWVVADDLPRDNWPQESIIYSHEEVRVLTKVGADTLALVHAVKELFNAQVVEGYCPREAHRTQPS